MFATMDGRSLVYAVGAAFKRWKRASGGGRGPGSHANRGPPGPEPADAPPARCVYVYKLHAGPLTEEDVEVEVVVGSLASAQAIDAAEEGLRAGAPARRDGANSSVAGSVRPDSPLASARGAAASDGDPRGGDAPMHPLALALQAGTGAGAGDQSDGGAGAGAGAGSHWTPGG